MKFLEQAQFGDNDLVPVIGRSEERQKDRYLSLCDWALGEELMTIEEYRQWTNLFFNVMKLPPAKAYDKLQKMIKARAFQKETNEYWERKNKEANERAIIDQALMSRGRSGRLRRK